MAFTKNCWELQLDGSLRIDRKKDRRQGELGSDKAFILNPLEVAIFQFLDGVISSASSKSHIGERRVLATRGDHSRAISAEGVLSPPNLIVLN